MIKLSWGLIAQIAIILYITFDELQIYSSTSSGEYIFIDDQSTGTPMVRDSRGGFMVDWPAVMEILKTYKLIT